jgi:GNAT superfamily N-acetyltransferase
VALTFRDGDREDAGLVADLHAACAVTAYAHIYPDRPFPFAATRRRWRGYNGRVVIAEEDGRAIGFAAFEGEWLHALYVLPDHWDRGVGGRLLELAGPVSVLWVLERNDRGRRFYERHGWAPDGRAQDASGAVELRYRRPVSPAGSCG